MLRTIFKTKYTLPLLFCLGLAIFYLFDYSLRVLPSVIAPGVTEAYRLSPIAYGNLCAYYYLIYVPLQLIVGLLVDRYRLVYLMTFALLLCALGCYLFANAHSYWLAVGGRLAMGLGAAFIFVSILKAISQRFSKSRFTFYLGIVICIGMLGGLVMDMFLVFVIKHWGWRLTCYFLSFSGLILVLFNIVDFKFERNVSRLSAKRKPLRQDIKDLISIMSNRCLWVQCLIGALLYLPIAGFAESWGIHFLNHTGQLSQLFASLDMGMMFLGFAVGAPILGWIYDRTSEYQLILTAGTVGTTILLSIVLYVPDLSTAKIGLFLFLLGFFSSSSVVVLALNRKLASKADAGKVFGVTNFVMMLAGGSAWLIGVIIQSIENSSYANFFSLYSVSNYQLAFIILPCGSLIAVFLTFFVRDHQLQ